MSTPALSDRRINANRRNARKSTGPRTPEGKARSSRNATTHGVFSVDIVVEGEDPREHSQYRIEMLRRLDPREPLELQFVEQFIRAGWKLQRLQFAELELFRDRRAERQRGRARNQARAGDDPMPELTPGLVLADILWGGSDFDRFQMYEQRLSNMMHRALNQYRKLRAEVPAGPAGDFTNALIQRENEKIEADTEKIENEPAAETTDVSDDPQKGSVTPPPPALCQIPGPWFGKPGPWPLEDLMYRPPKAPPAKPGR